MSTPNVSIIIPTYNRAAILKETLECLSHLDYPKQNFEIIVVDDGSSDRTAEVVTSFKANQENIIYHLKENGGASSARNEGARIAKADILLFNDDDIIVEPSMISQHVNTLSRFERALVGGHWEFSEKMKEILNHSVFGKYRIAVEEWVKEANKKNYLRDNCYKATSISSQNFSFRRDHFWDVGGFDPKFPYAGFEDHEFTRRVIKSGYTLIYDYDIKLSNNDLDRIDIVGFGERQKRGAIVKVMVANKNPEQCYLHPMIIENAPLRSDDSFAIAAKKFAKRILSSRYGLFSLVFFAKTFEKLSFGNMIVGKLYDITTGIYIFQGIRKGIELYGTPDVFHLGEDADETEIEIFNSQRKFSIKELK